VTVTQLAVNDEPFDAVAAEWSELLARCANPMPFATPQWQRVWLRHFQGERTLRVLSMRDGDRLAGVAPLLIDGDRAEFAGHYSICDYMDAVVASGYESEFFGRVLERLSRDGVRTLDLRGVRQWSSTLDAVCDGGAGAGYRVQREEEALSPSVELPGDWEAYLGQLSKKDRHELRRKLRRLMSAGGVALRVVTAPDEASEKLDTLFHLMRISSHHKEEFGPNEPDMNLYVGYPVTRSSLRRKLWRDARGTSGWKNLKGLLMEVAFRSLTRTILRRRLSAPTGTQPFD